MHFVQLDRVYASLLVVDRLVEEVVEQGAPVLGCDLQQREVLGQKLNIISCCFVITRAQITQ